MSRFIEIVQTVMPDCEVPRNLEPQLAAYVARAVTAWPTVHVDSEQFVGTDGEWPDSLGDGVILIHVVHLRRDDGAVHGRRLDAQHVEPSYQLPRRIRLGRSQQHERHAPGNQQLLCHIPINVAKQ